MFVCLFLFSWLCQHFAPKCFACSVLWRRAHYLDPPKTKYWAILVKADSCMLVTHLEFLWREAPAHCPENASFAFLALKNNFFSRPSQPDRHEAVLLWQVRRGGRGRRKGGRRHHPALTPLTIPIRQPPEGRRPRGRTVRGRTLRDYVLVFFSFFLSLTPPHRAHTNTASDPKPFFRRTSQEHRSAPVWVFGWRWQIRVRSHLHTHTHTHGSL